MSITLANQAQLNSALTEYRAKDKDGWIVLTYKTPTQLEFKASGSGLSSMLTHLKENEVAYCLTRQQYTEADPGYKHGADNKANTKDVFIAYTGAKVGIIEKGKKKAHVGDTKAFLQPFHSELTATVNQFTEALVKDRSGPLSGSHIID